MANSLGTLPSSGRDAGKPGSSTASSLAGSARADRAFQGRGRALAPTRGARGAPPCFSTAQLSSTERGYVGTTRRAMVSRLRSP
jgi:hypothetical protein